MKVSADKNMPARRVAAAAQINEIFADRLRQRPIDQLHTAKAEEARRVIAGAPSAMIEREAEQRNTTAVALASTIVDNHEVDTHAALLALEGERQDALAGIREAARPEDLNTIIAALAPPITEPFA